MKTIQEMLGKSQSKDKAKVKKPVSKKPVSKKPVLKKPILKKPVLKKPVLKNKKTKKSTATGFKLSSAEQQVFGKKVTGRKPLNKSVTGSVIDFEKKLSGN